MGDLARFIIIFSHVPIFAAALYALVIYRRLTNELKAFSWYLFTMGIIQLVSLILWTCHINNLPILHIYVPLSFLLLCRFYYVLFKGLINVQIIIWCAVIFTLLSIANSVFLQHLFIFNSYALTLHSVLVIILSITASGAFLNKELISRFRARLPGLNLINGGILIYHSSALLIFYFGNLITHRYSVLVNKYTWIAHSFLSVVMYLCFIFGLWKRERK